MSHQQPPPGYGPPRQPVVVDVAAGSWVKVVGIAVICGGIGLVAVISALVGAVTGGTGTRIAVAVVGVAFLLLGLAPVLRSRTLTRPRRLVLETGGVRWDDPRGTPWAVSWQELRGVAISTASKVHYGQAITTRSTLVRLDLFPRDQSVLARHPEMRHLWQASGARESYRLPLGPGEKHIMPIDQGLRALVPGLYRGVVDEGIAMGFRYT